MLGRRTDGYHEVHTLLQTVSLQDRLDFSFCEGPVRLSCNDPEIPLGKDNLIIRAADALQNRCRVEAGAVIHLEKRIPTKGGLGGASSNAAIALLGLARLWDLSLDSLELREIGATLGADVPFFFVGGCARATGIGTELKPIADRVAGSPADAEQKYLVIVTPNVSVSTAVAYEALKAPALTRLNDASILSISHAGENFELSHPSIPTNDFEDVIFGSAPEIGRAKKSLLDVGASSALLAGSGSSVFGIFENEQAQERAVKEIQAELGWRVFPVVTVSRREYLQELGSCGVALSRSELGLASEQSET